MIPNTITTSTSTVSNIISDIRSNPTLYSRPATTEAYDTHFSYITIASKADIDEINGILFDICDILADLYEKKRLGRDGNLSAIRGFLDSIKVTEG